MSNGQQDPRLDFNGLYAQAQDAMPELKAYGDDFLADIRRKYPGKFDDVRFEQGPLKKPERAQAKIDSDYEGKLENIADLVRGRLIVKTPEQVELLRSELQARHQEMSIETFKDNFAEPLSTHFRAINMKIRMPNGHLAEFRIDQRDIVAAGENTHKQYEEIQSIDRRTKLENRPMTDSERLRRIELRSQLRETFDQAAIKGDLDGLLNEKGRATLHSHGYHFKLPNRGVHGVGAALGAADLVHKLGPNGTFQEDWANPDTHVLAGAGIATDISAIALDGAETVNALSRISQGIAKAAPLTKAVPVVTVALGAASGGINYEIAAAKHDGGAAAQALGQTVGGTTGALAGTWTGTFIGGGICAWTGAGTVPCGIVGGIVGFAGALYGGAKGAENGGETAREAFGDNLQRRFDAQAQAEQPKSNDIMAPYHNLASDSKMLSGKTDDICEGKNDPEYNQFFRLPQNGL